ncbi:MAG: molybdenum cofactor guanylyltransferase [Chloroflexi bacterium]|nr:molybdenum cofactor guanylyltransferase [Chloroflexota bacterium]
MNHREVADIQLGEFSDVTGVVLAGGKSSRLGRNKAFEVVGEESLLKRTTRRLSALGEVLVVTNHQFALSLQDQDLGARVAEDIWPGMGPLGGIHSALKAATTQYILVVACDMPFLNWNLLKYEIGLRLGFDAVVPRLLGFPEALHSVYSKSCLPATEAVLSGGKSQVSLMLRAVRVRYVEQHEIEKFDPQHLSFFNVNTPADIDRARKLAVHDK